MSHNLQKCLKELQFVMKNRNKITRKNQLQYLAHKKCIYDAMREISINIMNKQIPLKKNQLKKLTPSQGNAIKRLATGVKNKKTRQKLIIQTGGFLPWLLPIIFTVLSTVVEKAIK